MRYLIKLASRGRPFKLMDAIKNVKETFVGDNYLIVVSMDEDDSTMTVMLDKLNNIGNVAAYVGKPWGKVAAINRDVNLYVPWDVLVNFSDDMVFKVVGWNETMDAKHRSVWGESTDYFAHWNDGHVKEKLPTMSVMGREYYERFGYIYHPSYKSFSCDAEAFYVAQMLNKWHYFGQQLFEHRHPVNVSEPMDKVYKANDAFMPYDTQMYFHRMSKDFYLKGVDTSIIDPHKR